MKQDIFDVLLYLFENYMHEDEIDQDKDSLSEELLAAGFHRGEIHKAFSWLEGLAEMQQREGYSVDHTSSSMRLFSEHELAKLDTDCRGFLLFLEQMGVLNDHTREMVVDRVMALESEEVELDQLKWVILMVLFNQPGQEAAVAWMEDLVLDEVPNILH